MLTVLLDSMRSTTPLLWACVVVVASVLYSFYVIVNRLVFSPIANFPGPWIAAVSFWYEFYFDVVMRGTYFREIEKMHLKYGPIVRINPYELHIDDPDFYTTLYSGPSSKREKWPWAAKMFGNNTSAFSTVSHDHHRLRRSALNPFFSKPAVQKLEPMIDTVLLQLCRRLDDFSQSRAVLDIGLAFTVFAADVITTYCFGESLGLVNSPDFAPHWVDMVAAPSELAHLVKQCNWLLPILRQLPKRLVKAIYPACSSLYDVQDSMGAQIETLIHKRRDMDPKPLQPVIFDALLVGKLPAAERTVDRLKGEGQTLIGAGTLTTGNVLKTIVFHVLENPTYLKTLIEELDRAFPDENTLPKLQKLEGLPFLTACISEGLRLAYGVSHRLQLVAPREQLHFQGFDIPPGTPVSMTSIFMHDNPIHFPEPRAFRPGRWMDIESRGRLSRYLVPFSKGTRSCLGMHLAYAQLYIVVGTVFRRYKPELFDTSREDVDMAHDFFDPSPKLTSKGLRVIITKR